MTLADLLSQKGHKRLIILSYLWRILYHSPIFCAMSLGATVIYALVAGTLHHAPHLQDSLAMLAAARWEEVNPLYHARIVLYDEGQQADPLVRHLHGQRASARRVNDKAALHRELAEWRPQLLIVIGWNHNSVETLFDSQTYLIQNGTAVMAVGPDGDEAAMSALDAGVDVYVGASVSENLILAQASALLRHGLAWEQIVIDIPGILRIDPESRRVRVYGQELRLTKRIFRLFQYLAQQSERTLSATEIAQHLAPRERCVQLNTVAAQIHRLRRSLEEVKASSWLQTVHGFGYRLSVPRPKKIP